MKDETYVFISDVKEKGSTGRSARARRTHTGKGGRVRLPSDNLSKKELQKMSGECKSYRLNEPMKWQEFSAMPDDIKVTYIKLIRQKFNPPVTQIAKMMGVTEACVRRELQRFGLTDGKKRSGRMNWDKEGFWAWVNGVDKLPTPVPEAPTEHAPVISEITQEEKEAIFFGEEKDYVEDDLPFEEPDPVPVDPFMEKCLALDVENELLKKRIDELLKVNEELQKLHTEDKELITWMQNKLCEIEPERDRLKAQMEVVQLIFGGKNHG